LTAVSAASFTGPELAPQSIATIFGTDMAGASIDVADRLVEVFGSTDTQASFVVPDGLAIGPVRIAAVREGQVLAEAEALIDTVSPGIFTAAATGSGVAAAQVVHTTTGGQLIRNIFDCSEAQSCMAAPIELFEDSVLVLYGTGIRAGTPIVRIGGLAAQVLYSGPHSLYLGLDQLNVKLPLELRGRGTVDVLVDVDGRLANLVQIAVR
jgi:uncharacterized protein (TIGR03437 family)